MNDMEQFAMRLWVGYLDATHSTHVMRYDHETALAWSKLKPEVQAEFRRYAVGIMARTERTRAD